MQIDILAILFASLLSFTFLFLCTDSPPTLPSFLTFLVICPILSLQAAATAEYTKRSHPHEINQY